MTSFKDAKGRKIVSTSTASTVGKVQHFLIDPASHRVVSVEVKKAESGDHLRWADIQGFGDDAVTVDDATRVKDAGPEEEALTGKQHDVLKKRVLTTGGQDLGTVSDVEFDAASGEVLTFLVKKDKRTDEVTGERLVGIGAYAVVVQGTDD